MRDPYEIDPKDPIEIREWMRQHKCSRQDAKVATFHMRLARPMGMAIGVALPPKKT